LGRGGEKCFYDEMCVCYGKHLADSVWGNMADTHLKILRGDSNMASGKFAFVGRQNTMNVMINEFTRHHSFKFLIHLNLLSWPVAAALTLMF
jgi:hypothetical protein